MKRLFIIISVFLLSSCSIVNDFLCAEAVPDMNGKTSLYAEGSASEVRGKSAVL